MEERGLGLAFAKVTDVPSGFTISCWTSMRCRSSPGVMPSRYADNYLHEAALADNASKTVYDLEWDGTARRSLGVHEHWNNAADKKYLRNLGMSG